MGNGAEITKGADVGADPVGQLLGPGRLGIGQVAVAHDPDEDLGFADLARGGIDDIQGRAAVIDKELVAGAVLLAHGTIQGLAPLPVEFAELTVLVAGWFPLFVLLPQQHEGEVFVAAQFIVQRLPVGLSQLTGRGWLGRRVETFFKGLVVKFHRPGQTGGDGPANRIIHGGLADTAGFGRITLALVAAPNQTQDFTDFSHGNSFSRHHALPG